MFSVNFVISGGLSGSGCKMEVLPIPSSERRESRGVDEAGAHLLLSGSSHSGPDLLRPCPPGKQLQWARRVSSALTSGSPSVERGAAGGEGGLHVAVGGTDGDHHQTEPAPAGLAPAPLLLASPRHGALSSLPDLGGQPVRVLARELP